MSQSRRKATMDAFHDIHASTYFQPSPHSDFQSPHNPSSQGFHEPDTLHHQPVGLSWPSNSPVKRSSSTSTPHFTPTQNPFDGVHLAPPPINYPTGSPSKTTVYMVPPMAQGHDLSYPYSTAPSIAYDPMFPFHVQGIPYPYVHEGLTYPQASAANVNNVTNERKRKVRDPSTDTDNKRARLREADELPIPLPEDIAVPPDDGSKPPLSYAQLIGLSILKSPDGKLTLSQIYDWIRSTYSFYVGAEAGWMNSIRHNLSLNKAFNKKERPKDDPGKGHYWTIVAGKERQFVRDGGYRISIPPISIVPTAVSSGHRDPPVLGQFKLPPKSSLKRNVDSSTFPSDPQPVSSDGTVPATDEASPPRPDQASMPPPKKKIRIEEADSDISPIGVHSLMEFNSSPPIVSALRHNRTHSSPTRSHTRQSSKSRPKSANVFKDSGFWSSIESSATRGAGPLHITSDPDHDERMPHINRGRGRAEDEIARLRSSSFDPSPTKGKSDSNSLSRQVSITVDASSPLKPQQDPFDIHTTAGKFGLQAPAMAPPAVSPSTNLRLHRERIDELVGTPARALTAAKLGGSLNTPGFAIHEDASFEDAFADNALADSISRTVAHFDLHSSLENFDAFDGWMESPIKKSVLASAKRPGMKRSATALGALEDITGRRDNIRLGSPIHMPPSQAKTPRTKISPVKNPATPLAPLDTSALLNIPSDDDSESTSKLDLLKGFRAIGGGHEADKENAAIERPTSQKKAAARPVLGRRSTQI